MNKKETQPKELTFTVVERAVLYARVSGNDKGKDNLPGQIEMGREYAQDKGYNIIAELSEDDRGASGYEIDLPQLNRIREMAHNGQFDVLIVREMDRLSRSLAKQLIIDDELKRAGVRVEYALAKYDDTPEGRLQKHIRATVAEYEREKIRERVQRGKERAARAGKVLMSFAPLGYDLANGKLTINEDEAAIVQLIFRLYVEESKSTVAVAKQLDDLGIIREGKSVAARKWRKHQKGWTPDAVRDILLNETYAGTFHYGQKNIEVPVPAIVERSIFEAVKVRMKANRRRGRKPNYDYLLSGLMTCGKCDYAYTAQCKTVNGKKYPKYGCSCRKNVYLPVICDAHFIRVNDLDTKVWAEIREILLDKDRLYDAVKQYNERQNDLTRPLLSEIETSERLLDKNRTELERLKKAYQAGILELEDIEEPIARLKDAIKKLTTARDEAKAKMEKMTLTEERINSVLELSKKTAPGVIYADKNFEARRALVKELETQVTLTPEGDKTRVMVVCMLGPVSDFVMDGN